MSVPGRTLLERLILAVSAGSFVFAIAAGFVTYRIVHLRNIDDAASLEQQLVHTVQAQAEVAVFAGNSEIADGVLEGLRANPRIRAVRIVGNMGANTPAFHVASGYGGSNHDVASTDYPLYSPINGTDRIGTLIVSRNEELIEAQATVNALNLTLLLLAQLLPTIVLLLLAYRHLVGRPIADLARNLARIEPGSGQRLQVPPTHAADEIGSLARSANELLSATETALDEIRTLATTDSLTGLSNRRAFLINMANELARLKRHEGDVAAVLMLDLDHFKDINDQFGHAAGDAALRDFSHTLQGELRRIDSAGRMGGEEFSVLLPGTDSEAAKIVAERIRERVAATLVTHDTRLLKITTSVGVAEMAKTDTGPEDALARADQALYLAKQNGRNRIEVAPQEAPAPESIAQGVPASDT